MSERMTVSYQKKPCYDIIFERDFQALSEEVKKVNNEIPKYKHIQYVTITTTPLIKTTTQKIKRFEEMKHIDE